MDEFSGVQKFSLDLTKFIVARGHRAILISRRGSVSLVPVVIFGSPKQLNSRKFAPDPLKKRQLPTNPIRTLLFFVFTTLAMIRICRRHRVSIIHTQDIFFSGFAGAIAHKLFEIPLIVHAHGPSPYFSEATSEATKLRRILMKRLAKVVMRKSSLIIATDIHTKNLLSPSVDKARVMCMPIPIDTRIYSKERGIRTRISRTPNESLILGFIGRLSPQKNLRRLLSAFASARASLNEKLRLVIVGNGPESSFLVREAGRLRLHKHIIFTGTVSENKKVELLNSFDIFLMPSLYEGCPIALLEAMASGKTIIASDIPSIREIVRHGEEAILVNPYDVEELEQAILLLYNDPDLRAKLGRNARERAKLYNVDRVYGLMLKVYEELIHRKGKMKYATVKKFS